MDAADRESEGPGAEPGRRSVILIHGWMPKPWCWDAYRAGLVAAGWDRRDVVTMDYESQTLRIVEVAEQIDDLVDRVLADRPGGQVDMITHSQGSLAARYAIKLGRSGGGKVHTWVSLAGINHGTAIAALAALNPLYRDLLPSSPLLGRLNEPPEAPPPTRWITYQVPEDVRFPPRESTRLDGADNRRVPESVTHAGVTGHRPTMREVIAELRSAESVTAPAAAR